MRGSVRSRHRSGGCGRRPAKRREEQWWRRRAAKRRRMWASTCEEERGEVVAASSCEEAPLGRETTEARAAASGPVLSFTDDGLLGFNIKGRLLADKNFKPPACIGGRAAPSSLPGPYSTTERARTSGSRPDMSSIARYKAEMLDDVPHIFKAVFQCTLEQLKLVIDSINWAFRHTDINIAETGLSLLLEILKNFQTS